MRKIFILLLSSFIFCELNIFENTCNNFEIDFNPPEISASAVSQNGKFELIVNDDGSIVLKDLIFNTEKVILPEDNHGSRPCGSMDCDGEQRVLFTSNGKFAITTTTFRAGKTIIWDTNTWEDISSKILDEYGGIGGGFFRLSNNDKYLIVFESHMKFGNILSILNLESFKSKIIGGSMYMGKDFDIESGLKFDDNWSWLDKITPYGSNFSNDNNFLYIKADNNNYIIYDINEHSLSSCVLNDNYNDSSINILEQLEEKAESECKDNNTCSPDESIDIELLSECDKYSIFGGTLKYKRAFLKVYNEFLIALRNDNKEVVADFIGYPIEKNGLTLYNKNDLIANYENLFPDSKKQIFYDSEFYCMGWKGMMLGSGTVWFNTLSNKDKNRSYYKIIKF